MKINSINTNLNNIGFTKSRKIAKSEIKISQRSFQNKAETKECDNFTFPDSILRLNKRREREKLLTPIKSEEEYLKTLNEICWYKFHPFLGLNVERLYISLMGYENVDEDLMGLVPYCGKCDISSPINIWVSGRENIDNLPILPDDKMANIVRILEYSLDKLDEKYGKYQGIVYRAGFFNPLTDKQFYSSSFLPDAMFNFSSDLLPSPENNFSIIKVKNGHKIYKFQEDTGSEVSKKFTVENEVLIDRKSRFKFISNEECSQSDKELKTEFLAKILNISFEKAKSIIGNKHGYGVDKYIYLWEEV